MPNLGGPSGRTRRLYAHVAHSTALYGAPIWADKIGADRRSLAVLRRVQRRMAIRVTRGYRTVSHAAATLLAGMPPIDLIARAYTDAYKRIAELKAQGVPITGRARRLINLEARREARGEWEVRLADPDCPGQRTISAILPCMEAWLERSWARASFRTTQVLTGHGCFGEYLCRIGREPNPACHHCEGDLDTAQHTLGVCPAWDEQRQALRDRIGADLSLPAVVGAIVEREDAWEAFANYCERVMRAKEKAERVRRGENVPPGAQDRGGGGPRRGRRRRGIAAHRRPW
ncbi:PREDICTED: uncharacterized protein LOC105555668 [Vollenhovia emeryi]|uniref:uncharacterized protein LOC105555668 n=1 Tax=Vollenhovia emeryi TaxID=411798 RepID=UPI0005F56723|nr:PREDICTED: uncharacterized protein LOC105555668 [Vollenhovia emeryi]